MTNLRVSLAVVCTVTLSVAGCDASDDPRSATTETSTTNPIPATEPRTSTTQAPATSAAPASSETTPPLVESLTRPIVDPEVCESFAAVGGDPQPRTLNPDGSPLTLFSRPSAQPVPVQVLANPIEGPAGPFALVQRFFDGQLAPIGTDSVRIGASEFFVRTYDNGNGEVSWVLDDGSQGYLRSRGLDHNTLVDIVSALSPRPEDATVPGFDYGSAVGELVVVVDQLNTDVGFGSYASSQCRVAANDYVYRIWLMNGSAMYQYASVIDRPPPIDVGYENGTVVSVTGINVPGAPTADDIVNADPATWQQLLADG